MRTPATRGHSHTGARVRIRTHTFTYSPRVSEKRRLDDFSEPTQLTKEGDLTLSKEATEQHRQMGKGGKCHLGLEEPKKLRPPPMRTPCQQELDQVLERISTVPSG
ncbi:hypothetical protein CB1_002439009 [Camelus ferus]|nr:hypothetical protein CB1_002439009 [Camelus ferus]